MELLSTLVCPSCERSTAEAMPTDACQFFYDCKGCGQRLKPKPGDCCVFCSYGSVLSAGPAEREALLSRCCWPDRGRPAVHRRAAHAIEPADTAKTRS